ncbi:MAG: PAS domain-containing protein [Pseudomonadota bacterium]
MRKHDTPLEGLLESETAGYWDWNIRDGTGYLSPRFKSMFGYAEHEMENSPDAWQRIIHPDDLDSVLEMFDAHVASRGEAPYDKEVRYFHKDGSIVWVLCRGRVVEWDDQGAPIRMMGIHMDITALKEREQAIQRRADDIRRFAFTTAHDLIQPINTFESALSLLIEDLPPFESQDRDKLIEFLTVSSSRMKSRITGILDYSRLQDGSLEHRNVDMNAVVADVLADLRAPIEDADARVEVGDLPNASGSARLLGRVFQNLLSNALKYRSPDRPCRIQVDRAEAPGGMVGFAVTDNGTGIDPSHHKRMFELFSRLHTDKKYEGDGVGLALCERIVTRHGGQIAASRPDGHGLRVVFTLAPFAA